MKTKRPWISFQEQCLNEIFTMKAFSKPLIVDIGGGLRIDPTKNNRKGVRQGFKELLLNVDYKIMDVVADYNPDIVGDIHKMPFADGSVDALLCMSVLEHVEEPQQAVREMYRVLKPGGYCYIEVPFIFYYHPMKGYYKDFYRFTYDGLEYMTKDFKEVKIQNFRGAIATAMNLFPLFSRRTRFFEWLDRLFGKEDSKQTSFYYVLCRK